MNKYKNKSFFKIVVQFGFIFLVAVSIIKIVMSIFSTGSIAGMVDEHFAENKWQLFVKIQIVISLAYGLIMAGYYKFIKK
jgi:uncharacterized BrkB/YihY/UPF0761 family membrane protein